MYLVSTYDQIQIAVKWHFEVNHLIWRSFIYTVKHVRKSQQKIEQYRFSYEIIISGMKLKNG